MNKFKDISNQELIDEVLHRMQQKQISDKELWPIFLKTLFSEKNLGYRYNPKFIPKKSQK